MGILWLVLVCFGLLDFYFFVQVVGCFLGCFGGLVYFFDGRFCFFFGFVQCGLVLGQVEKNLSGFFWFQLFFLGVVGQFYFECFFQLFQEFQVFFVFVVEGVVLVLDLLFLFVEFFLQFLFQLMQGVCLGGFCVFQQSDEQVWGDLGFVFFWFGQYFEVVFVCVGYYQVLVFGQFVVLDDFFVWYDELEDIVVWLLCFGFFGFFQFFELVGLVYFQFVDFDDFGVM